jgi:hypothetical protein
MKARLGSRIEDAYFLKIIRHFNRNGEEVPVPNAVQQEVVRADDAGNPGGVLKVVGTGRS